MKVVPKKHKNKKKGPKRTPPKPIRFAYEVAQSPSPCSRDTIEKNRLYRNVLVDKIYFGKEKAVGNTPTAKKCKEKVC